MQEIIAAKLDEIAGLCRRHHVRRLAVFGSAARGTDFSPDTSDIDLLVEFGEVPVGLYAQNLVELEGAFQYLFRRKVELLTLRFVKNPFLLRRILAEQQTLYAA